MTRNRPWPRPGERNAPPEVYLLNAQDEVVYRGRMDDSPKDPGQVTTEDLRDALAAMLSGHSPAVDRTQSIGCSVKWKA